MSLKNAGKNVFEKEDGALEAFRRYLELDEKSEATIRKYMHDVKVFLTFQKGKGSFRKEQIIEYKNWLGERYAVRSANSMLTAVNQFLKSSCSSCSTRLFVTRERSWGGRNIGAFWRQPGGKNRSVCTS